MRLLCLTLLTLCAACSRPVDLQAELDALVEANNGYGAATLRIAHGDDVVWEGVSGTLTHDANAGMTLDSPFEVASTSKTFTAAVVLTLVDEGALDLDAPMGELFGPTLTDGLLVVGGQNFGPTITVRQLLGHTSGLADYWYDPPYVSGRHNAFLTEYIDSVDRTYQPAELVDYCKALDPIGAPGEAYHYGDCNYVLLGLLIEQLTGQPLHEAYRTRLFEPLGLHQTHLSYREPAASSEPPAHRYEGRWDMTDKPHQSADWAGGGLISTHRDLARFLLALDAGELFSDPTTLEQMQAWTEVEPWVWYGLGVFKATLPHGRGSLWGHDGYGNAFMYHWPERDIVFTGSLNQTETDWWPLVVAATRAVEEAD